MSEQQWKLVPTLVTSEIDSALLSVIKPGVFSTQDVLDAILGAAPQPPAHNLLASLERFESNGEDFVRLHDVNDAVAMIKQPPALDGEHLQCASCFGSGIKPKRLRGEGETAYRARCKALSVGGDVGALVSLIVRDLCETEPDDSPNAVHVRMSELESILTRHVARLQAEVERQRRLKLHIAENLQNALANCSVYRLGLSERDALLQLGLTMINRGIVSFDDQIEYRQKLNALANGSAPTESDGLSQLKARIDALEGLLRTVRPSCHPDHSDMIRAALAEGATS